MEVYYKMLEWLYLNDNKFNSALEWRKALLEKLKSLLLFRDEQRVEIVSIDTEEIFKDLIKVLEDIDKKAYGKRK